MSKIYTSIPDPTDDIAGLRATIEALKMNVEILMGVRGQNGWANQIFLQAEAPEASKAGDIWIKKTVLPTDVFMLSIWDGNQWLKT